MLIQKINKIYKWKYFPFLILGVLMLVMHMLMKESVGDDVYFSNAGKEDLLSYLAFRYHNWSSRIIIEFALILIFKLEFLVWKMINIIIYLLLGFLLSKIFVNPKTDVRKANWFIVGMLLIYPFYHMGSAGWVTTCVFYLYPLFLLIYCIYEVKKVFENRKIYWFEYILYFFALLFATSMEQITAMLTVLFIVLIIYTAYQKNYRHLYGISLAVCFFQILFALTCPGNGIRQVTEIGVWYPGYESFNMFDKLNLGFYTTIIQFLSSYDGVFIIFCLLLLGTIMYKYKKIWYNVIAAIPSGIWAFLVSVWLLLKSPVRHLVSNNSLVKAVLKLLDIGNEMSVPSKTILLSLALLGVLLLLIYLVTLAFDKSEVIFVLFILALGFGSRILLGFSPTVYGSGYRISLYLYFSLIIGTILLMNKQMPILSGKKIFVRLFQMVCGLSYIVNIYYVWR